MQLSEFKDLTIKRLNETVGTIIQRDPSIANELRQKRGIFSIKRDEIVEGVKTEVEMFASGGNVSTCNIEWRFLTDLGTETIAIELRSNPHSIPFLARRKLLTKEGFERSQKLTVLSLEDDGAVLTIGQRFDFDKKPGPYSGLVAVDVYYGGDGRALIGDIYVDSGYEKIKRVSEFRSYKLDGSIDNRPTIFNWTEFPDHPEITDSGINFSVKFKDMVPNLVSCAAMFPKKLPLERIFNNSVQAIEVDPLRLSSGF